MRQTRPEVGAAVSDLDLSEQTVLVTGSTSGVGRETALALGRLGATVIVHGRDRERGQAVVTELMETGASGATFHRADFADFEAVRDLAATVRDEHDDLDVLVNNAGGYFTSSDTTENGIEFTIAVNHLAPFLLTAELLPALRSADSARVVTTSSEAHRGGEAAKLVADLSDPRGTLRIGGWSAYAQSKLANVLFTRELARRLDAADADVTANCFHPGTIPGSGFARNLPGPTASIGSLVSKLPIPGIATPADGAKTAVHLAVSPKVDTAGGYFANCRERRPSRAARDDPTARRLWEQSVDLTDLDEDPLPAAE